VRRYLNELVAIFVISFLIAVLFPRHAYLRQGWGLPFEYRYTIKAPQGYPGYVEEASVVRPAMLFWDVWIIFVLITFFWYGFRNVKARLEDFTFKK